MTPHKFQALKTHSPEGKPMESDWCAYIDKPVQQAEPEDFCQKKAEDNIHQQDEEVQHDA